MNSLPTELIHAIIDSLVPRTAFSYPRHVVKDLLSLSLVNHAFHRRAAFHLFRCIDLLSKDSISLLSATGVPCEQTVQSLSIHRSCFWSGSLDVIQVDALGPMLKLVKDFAPTLERIIMEGVPASTFEIDSLLSDIPNLDEVALTDYEARWGYSDPEGWRPCYRVRKLAVYDPSFHPSYTSYLDLVVPRFPNVELLVLAWSDTNHTVDAVESILDGLKQLQKLVIVLPPYSHIVFHSTPMATVEEKRAIAARYPRTMITQLRAPDEPRHGPPSWAKTIIREGKAWSLSGEIWG